MAAPPPLDLTLADTSDRPTRWPKQLGGVSLLPGHVPLAFGACSRAAGLRGGQLVGAGHRRLAPRPPARPRGRAACSTCAPRRAARRCSLRAPAGASPRSIRRKVVLRDFTRISSGTHLAGDGDHRRPAAVVAARHLSMRCCSMRRAAPPVSSAATPTCCTACAPRRSPNSPRSQAKLLARAADWVKPGGPSGVRHLLARTR